MSAQHCPTCVYGRRAAVQNSSGKPDGTISWEEHLDAFARYAVRFAFSGCAERIHENGGFTYDELVMFLGRAPTTWRPR